MKRLSALLVFSLFSPGLCFEMTNQLAKMEIDVGGKAQVTTQISSIKKINVTLLYTIYDEEGSISQTLHNEYEIQGTKSIRKNLDVYNSKPGHYNLTIEASYEGEEANQTFIIRIIEDCVEFSGISKAYALEGQGQDFEFDLLNTCNYTLHNIDISFLDYDTSLILISDNRTVRMTNVTSPKVSKHVRLSASYDEGYSREDFEFIILSRVEMNELMSGLYNSSLLMYNKSKNNMLLAFLGDRELMMSEFSRGSDLFTQANLELDKENYALATKYFSESVLHLRESNDLAQNSINLLLGFLAVAGVVFSLVLLLFIYNKYRSALKLKQLGELGKS